jgi:hypothetical protein
MEERQGSKLVQFLCTAFCGGSMIQLWPLRNWLDQTERQKAPECTAASQKPRALQSAPLLSLLGAMLF